MFLTDRLMDYSAYQHVTHDNNRVSIPPLSPTRFYRHDDDDDNDDDDEGDATKEGMVWQAW